MKRDVSLGKKFVNLISSSIWISIKNSSEAHEVSCLYFALIQEIPQQVRQQLRPKPKSSGLGMEANLDFHDKNSSFNAPISANKVPIFKLTIK